MDASILSDSPSDSWLNDLGSKLLNTAVQTGTALYNQKNGPQTAQNVAAATTAPATNKFGLSAPIMWAIGAAVVGVVLWLVLKKK